MKITKELLKEKGACAAGYRDFLKEYPVDKYPDGVEYQELLDCCAEKDFSYGSWLLGAFGKTDEVRKIDGDLIVEKGIIFAGRLEVKGCIKAGLGIKAGCGVETGGGIETGSGIEAGNGIKAGLGIKAGWSIRAGKGIETGYGIEAGGGIKAGFGIKADEGIKAGYGIKAGDGIEAGWGIEAGEGIEAGNGIKAGGGIKAGWSIKAGFGIKAGDGIEAGDEFGIYAGLRFRITNKTQRKIIAKERPENIMCGEFEEKKDDAVR